MRYSYELWIFWRKLAMGWVSTLACGKVTCVHLPNVVLWPCQGRALRLIMCLLISIQEYTCEQNHLASPLCWLERFVQEYLADEYYVSIYSFTWKIYAERLMTLSRVYGFWKYVSKLHRRESRRYLEMFYILKFRELVWNLPHLFLVINLSFSSCNSSAILQSEFRV